MEENTEKKTRQVKGKQLTLLEKLLEVRKSVDYLQKSTKGGQFNYTSSSQVIAAVRQKMNELGILLVSNINESKVTSTPNRNQVLSHFTELTMTMSWVDVSTGDTLDIPWYGQGVDLAGEKGVGKALTYAEKYFILKQFNIPTDKDDPDAFQEKSLPQTDVKALLILQLNEAVDLDTVNKIWANNPKLKKDEEFVSAVKRAGTRLKLSSSEEKSPEQDKEKADAHEQAE